MSTNSRLLLAVSALAACATTHALYPKYYGSWAFRDSTCVDEATVVESTARMLDTCTHGATDTYIITCNDTVGYEVTKTTYSDDGCTVSTGSEVLYSNSNWDACIQGTDGLYYKNFCARLSYFVMEHALYTMLYEDATPESSCNSMLSTSTPSATTVVGRSIDTCLNAGDGTSFSVSCGENYLGKTSYTYTDCTGSKTEMSTTSVKTGACLSTTTFPYITADPDSYMFFYCTPYNNPKSSSNDDDDEIPDWGVALIVLVVLCTVTSLFLFGRHMYTTYMDAKDTTKHKLFTDAEMANNRK